MKMLSFEKIDTSLELTEIDVLELQLEEIKVKFKKLCLKTVHSEDLVLMPWLRFPYFSVDFLS